MKLKNAVILADKFKKSNIEIKNGRFFSIDETADDGIDMSGKYIVPGLIDIHTHGANGFDNSDKDPEAIEKIAQFMINEGVTSYAPTFITGSEEEFIKASENVDTYIRNGEKYAKIAGIHMEGPYFSHKFKGAQNERFLRNPDVEEFSRINDAAKGRIKLISMAPELDGAIEFIRQIKDKAVISIGHTDSDYETAKKAINAGASHMTHTFNAMRGFHHRNPNAIGAAFDSNITCECICDGIHIHEAAVRTLYKIVGADRLIFISDSMRATGLSDGTYMLGGQEVTVKGRKALLLDGTIAGSTATLLFCVKKAIDFGIPAEDAFRCASINPARVMGIDDKIGSIEKGKCADFLVLDEKFNLCDVYKDGIRVKRK